jgi:hypothetical protein
VNLAEEGNRGITGVENEGLLVIIIQRPIELVPADLAKHIRQTLEARWEVTSSAVSPVCSFPSSLIKVTSRGNTSRVDNTTWFDCSVPSLK